MRRVCLGMPAYGTMTSGASRGLWRSSRGHVLVKGEHVPLDLQVSINETSLLAHNFNLLWCWALNMRADIGVDYFAMLHADVEPEDFWLDAMISELEDRDLDVLGAVVPIKDAHGLTSVAVGREDGDPWRPHCRLTMAEVSRLPVTFTSDDIGGRDLLLNTGLWACKLGDWSERCCFTIRDRIVRMPNGRLAPEVEPEDWNFSRQLNRMGLRIGATRLIPLAHRGPVAFANSHSWGTDQVDSHYLADGQSVVSADAKQWAFPAEIDGWLTVEEGRFLAEVCRDKLVLEIGSYCGRSTVCIAQTARETHSVDPHDGRGTAVPRSTYEIMRGNLERYRDRIGEVTTVVSTFADYSGWWSGPKYDVIFIDGAHDYESVRRDIELATPMLADGGLLLLHDYRPHGATIDPGVVQAVNELLEAGGQVIQQRGTVAAIRPPQPIGV